MPDPHPTRSLRRVWMTAWALVIVLVVVYAIRRVTSAPVEVRTDSVPATPSR